MERYVYNYQKKVLDDSMSTSSQSLNKKKQPLTRGFNEDEETEDGTANRDGEFGKRKQLR